jgi:hypothetical protein
MSSTGRDKLTIHVDVGDKAPDRIAAVMRSVVGAVPIVGSLLAEIVTEIVPNQRIERIEKFLLFLAEELDRRAIADLRDRITKPETIDLIEEGGLQATRALTDERKRYLARCVANGIASDELGAVREKRVLNLLAQLDDEELLILDAYEASPRENKFEHLVPEPAVVGSPPEVVNREALYRAARDKLERLGLLETRVRLDPRTKMPEWDTFTGQPKGSRTVTRLGRLVLQRIGLTPDDPDA